MHGQMGGGGSTPPMDQKSRPPSMDDFGPSHRVKKKDSEVFWPKAEKNIFSGKMDLKHHI